MSTQNRITQMMRDSWSRQIVKKVLEPKQTDFDQRVKQLITLMIDSFVSTDKKAWDSFPNVWKAKARTITIFVNNSHDKCIQVRYESPISIPANKLNYGDQANFNVTKSDTKFYEQVVSLVEEQKELQFFEQEVRKELRAVLSSAKTLKQLRELWPDIDKYIDLSKFSSGGQLVRVDTSKLNSLLAEPAKKSKANLRGVS